MSKKRSRNLHTFLEELTHLKRKKVRKKERKKERKNSINYKKLYILFCVSQKKNYKF